MYIPAHFNESRPDVLFDLIENNALGTLITQGKNGLDANHIPFELARTTGPMGTLLCHVARNNPVWQDVVTGAEVLVVFRAGDAYISPTWYPSKHELHRQVPTWNYIVAHVHGRITIHDDEGFVRRNVAKLTRKHEANQPEPWQMAHAPKDYLDAMFKAIVGLEIEITKLEGKSKLSQNKEMRDIQSAADALVDRGQETIGKAMKAAIAGKP
jgi:transcriptional regulator